MGFSPSMLIIQRYSFIAHINHKSVIFRNCDVDMRQIKTVSKVRGLNNKLLMNEKHREQTHA